MGISWFSALMVSSTTCRTRQKRDFSSRGLRCEAIRDIVQKHCLTPVTLLPRAVRCRRRPDGEQAEAKKRKESTSSTSLCSVDWCSSCRCCTKRGHFPPLRSCNRQPLASWTPPSATSGPRKHQNHIEPLFIYITYIYIIYIYILYLFDVTLGVS